MLHVDRIRKRFGDLLALDDVSLAVRRGQVVGFLGPNGAGKTTTMRAIMGLISVDGGVVHWDGTPITDAVRRRFGYMPAERGMYPKMRVGEQIQYFARLAGLGAADARAACGEWTDRLGIAARLDDEVQALSSGNQQRVQLAISLVHHPELLVLDEPFSGLDPVAVETMKRVLREQVDAGAAVLFSSHQLDLVADLTDQVVIVESGRVVLDGDVRELRRNSPVRLVRVAYTAPPAPADVPAGWEAEVDGVDATVRVPADVTPAEALATTGRWGDLVSFDFAPPDLSDVFLQSVGR
ncbi:MAG: ATP-binding cassette domain-containing protein [Acidimicrobiales bacterium]|nr:ATP-binding cassette domain-containing protein [Acidimicrobiales bacterium]MCB9393447.1 ATP-binding cassette domain-containing protein [Acidimicrobiaceae bacterium]